MRWFFSPDGIQRDELSEDALATMAREGKLHGDMLLWREGMAGWQPAREVRPEWFGLSGPPAPAAQPPPAGPTTNIPAWGPAASPASPSDSAAMISVVSGGIGLATALTGICCCCGLVVSPVAGVIAVVYGHQAYSRTTNRPGAENDRNLALAGLILGYLSLLVTVGSFLYTLLVAGLAGFVSMTQELSNGNFPF